MSNRKLLLTVCFGILVCILGAGYVATHWEGIKKTMGKEPCQVMIENQLKADLLRGDKDQIYRAASYISRHGGPELPVELPHALIEWRPLGQKYAQWIDSKSKKKIAVLLEGYAAYVETWSPAFPPEVVK